VALRDALLDARVDRGAARAAAHAGLEMLLDGHLIADPEVARATDAAFAALAAPGPAHDAALALAAPADRYVWGERLDHLAGALDPQSYSSARGVARRLERMTRGRTRIELRSEHVETVAGVLEGYVPVVARDGARVVDDVLVAV